MEYSLLISVRAAIETTLNIGTNNNHLVVVPKFMVLFAT